MKLFENRAIRWAAAIASGIMLARAVGLAPIWWLAWIAPIPLLLAALNAEPWEAALLAFVAGVIESVPMAHLMLTVNGPVATPVLMGLFGVMWAAAVSITRAIAARSRGWITTLAYPAAWAALEIVLSAFSPHGTYGSMAYSQMNAVAVIQVASLAGCAGVVFLMSIPASIVALALRQPKRSRPALAYGVPAAVLIAALVWGAVRASTPLESSPLKVAMLAIDPANSNAYRTGVAPVWSTYMSEADRMAARGARAVLMPEAISVLNPNAQRELGRELGERARTDSVYIAAGVITKNGSLMHNRAWVYGPAGVRLASYTKHHLVPGLESSRLTPGTGLSTFALDGHRMGVEICKDMDFPALSRRYAGLGVEALVVPAWDFSDGWLHSRMAMMRGVENGFSIIRSAADGMLTVSNAYGEVEAQSPSRPAPGGSVMATAAISPRIATLYSKVGDLFGYLCLAAIIIALVLVLIPGALSRRTLRREETPSGDPADEAARRRRAG